MKQQKVEKMNKQEKIKALKQQTDGKIVIAGSSGSNFYRIKRFNIDGTIDNTFSVGLNPSDGFNNTIYKIALQSDGKFIVQGQFTAYGTTTIKQSF